jgi:formate-dependent nitrite reductase membrane component NrfD
MIEHFGGPPNWGWYIVFYFFFGGVSGGAYTLGTLLRLRGGRANVAGARVAFLVAWPVLIVCPVLLLLDLGTPIRFWHMLIDAGEGGIVFKYWSPMSVGSWALAVFGVFATISFAGALGWLGGLSGRFWTLFTGVGTIFGLFVAGYTGVLLSVSNQPIWSDSWVIGGLFLASALSGAAAAIALFAGLRPDAGALRDVLREADAYFIVLEVVLVVLFLATLGNLSGRIVSGTFGPPFWLGAVVLGMAVPLVLHVWPRLTRAVSPLVAPILVLVGVLALRAVVILSAQA